MHHHFLKIYAINFQNLDINPYTGVPLHVYNGTFLFDIKHMYTENVTKAQVIQLKMITFQVPEYRNLSEVLPYPDNINVYKNTSPQESTPVPDAPGVPNVVVIVIPVIATLALVLLILSITWLIRRRKAAKGKSH